MASARTHCFRTPAAAVLAVLLALPLVAACNRGEEAMPSLTVYSGRSEQLVGPLFRQFTEQTGIKVEARYGDTAELAAQILEEGAGSPAQVFFAQDAGALGAVEAAGLFAPLPAGAADSVRRLSGAGRHLDRGHRPRPGHRLRPPAGADRRRTAVRHGTDRPTAEIAPTNASFQAFVTAMRVADGDDVTRRWLEGLVQ